MNENESETPVVAEPVPQTFAELGVAPDICASLEDEGITHAFPIQAATLPLALQGNDLIGQAKTGTGKTLGFGIPVLQLLEKSDHKQPQALIVVPTRELCVQVANDLSVAGKRGGARVLAVYGGRAYEPQVEALKKGIDIVVGTPGRLLDLARQGFLQLSKVHSLVLDEADEMLDMGFLPDVESIVSQLPAKRQTMLFSATMPGQILSLARRYMTQPTHIRASDPNDEGATVESIEQHIWRAHNLDKIELLARAMQAEGRGLSIVFCTTKRTAQKVADELNERGFAAGTVHGNLGQGAREQALRAFRNGKIDILVATDVAARGIDVEGVTHVVNYSCPDDEKTYLHRVGRTGRAGASGVAITLVDWDDVPRWKLINKTLGLAFHEPIETYSTSDHVFTGLGISRDVKGSLPRSQRTRAGLEAEAVEDLGETGQRSRQGEREKPARERRDKDRAPSRDRQRRRTRGGSGGSDQGGSSQSGSETSSAGGSKTGTDGAQEKNGNGNRSRSRNRRRTRGGQSATPANGSED